MYTLYINWKTKCVTLFVMSPHCKWFTRMLLDGYLIVLFMYVENWRKHDNTKYLPHIVLSIQLPCFRSPSLLCSVVRISCDKSFKTKDYSSTSQADNDWPFPNVGRLIVIRRKMTTKTNWSNSYFHCIVWFQKSKCNTSLYVKIVFCLWLFNCFQWIVIFVCSIINTNN